MPLKKSSQGRVRIAQNVLHRPLGEESILLNLETETYLGLDAVGTRMWTLLTESPSVDDAYRALLDEYDAEPERLHADLHEFISKLRQHGLIELDVPSGPDSHGTIAATIERP